MTVRFVRMKVAYDGAEFFGWQSQPDQRTVQAVIENALCRVTGEAVRVVAAGRTDTGVHAWEQTVSFAIGPRLDNHVLRRALNANLPPDVAVLEIVDAPHGFNAIDHALGKRYCYLIQDGPCRDVFARKRAWRVWSRLDVPAMHAAAQPLTGRHDFSAFENQGSPRVHPVRTVREIRVERRAFGFGERVAIEVTADGFLYNMVRNIVGTLVEVGKGKRPLAWPGEVLATRNRILAGMCAPPQGLYLVKVFYADDHDLPPSPDVSPQDPHS